MENDIATSSLVGCITLKTPIAEADEKLRTTLNIPPRWAFSYSSADTAICVLTQRLEDAGIFVAYNGVVANNTHRKLAVSECRGFAITHPNSLCGTELDAGYAALTFLSIELYRMIILCRSQCVSPHFAH